MLQYTSRSQPCGEGEVFSATPARRSAPWHRRRPPACNPGPNKRRRTQANALPRFSRLGGGGSSSARAARQRLLQELSSAQPNKDPLILPETENQLVNDGIEEAIDALIAAEVPFKEAMLGPGPYVAVCTRGPLLWTLWTGTARRGSRVARPSDNQASQAFDPASKSLVNSGQLLGGRVSVTATGSYAAEGEGARCPKLVRAAIEGGSLRVGSLEIPLPIKGKGVVEVAYLDPELRVFRAPNGSLSVQIRQDRLPALLGWPAR